MFATLATVFCMNKIIGREMVGASTSPSRSTSWCGRWSRAVNIGEPQGFSIAFAGKYNKASFPCGRSPNNLRRRIAEVIRRSTKVRFEKGSARAG